VYDNTVPNIKAVANFLIQKKKLSAEQAINIIAEAIKVIISIYF